MYLDWTNFFCWGGGQKSPDVLQVRMLACELVASLEQPGGTPAVPLQGNAREDVPAEPVVREDEQAKALRCGDLR